MCTNSGCDCNASCTATRGEPGIQGIPGVSPIIQQGETTLIGGTKTIASLVVASDSLIFLSRKTGGGVLGNLTYTITAGVQFVINSDSALDTSIISYIVI